MGHDGSVACKPPKSGLGCETVGTGLEADASVDS